MSIYRIQGGIPLHGEVTISGSKNAALGVLAAAMAIDGPSVIENVPRVSDIETLLRIFSKLGADVEWLSHDTVSIDPTKVTSPEALMPEVHELRGSYYLLGAFLGRFSRVRQALPGGCNFGSRPIDLHLKGFTALGAANQRMTDEQIEIEAERGLKGASIFLNVVSVGATINIMLAAVHAEGVTVIDNAAKEPHIVDVANFLNAMGAEVRGAGTDVIKINGKAVLPGRKTYAIIPDQIEAGTFMMMAPLTHGDIKVNNVIPTHMEPLTNKLIEMGCLVEVGDDSIRTVLRPDETYTATTFKTMPYPGFPTDLQPQTVAMLCGAEGSGRVIENVWDNRYQYIEHLQRMGANIMCSGRLAIIQGGVPLKPATVPCRDLRAGAAMVMAALATEGESVIEQIETIERGYENFVQKLQGLGARISEERSK
ncbi:MAG: UDP-N-acetylglucosamine 1-carboxyvinyltransferase [Eubacteriales bacterium]|nr:UDP-N-acetylglucosamine 1-carboxyvinyltransferase [Eubacteriales bacterium]